jgi:hypothetical protein
LAAPDSLFARQIRLNQKTISPPLDCRTQAAAQEAVGDDDPQFPKAFAGEPDSETWACESGFRFRLDCSKAHSNLTIHMLPLLSMALSASVRANAINPD